MDDSTASRKTLLEEVHELRRRNAELEDALAERSEAVTELRDVLDAVPVLVCVAGLDGYYKRVNQAFETVLGYSNQESLSRPFLEFIHPDDREDARRNLEKLAAGECLVDFEDRNVCRDGSYRWISWTVVPFPEKGLVYGVGHDITVQKQAVLALRESEARFRSVYEAGMMGIAFWDSSDIIRVANDAYLKIVGVSRPEMSASRVRRSEHCCSRDALNERDYCAPIEAEFIHKDGKRVFALVGCTLLGSEHYEGVSFCIDITQRKQSEAALQKAHNELEHRVEQRTLQLAATNEQLNREILERTQAQKTLRESETQLKKDHQILTRLLSQHDRERQMISYEIHDGLAQTLAGAIMQFQTLCRQLDVFPESAVSARDNLQALLDHSLAEARRLISGVRPPVLDDSGVLVAIQDLIDASAGQGAVCEFECNGTFERLDPVLEITIYRIVQESLANAFQHSQSERILLQVSQRDRFIHIRVQDWGVGFDPQQVNGRQFGIMGIRERANLVGGSSNIISEPGQGTQVSIELPLKLD